MHEAAARELPLPQVDEAPAEFPQQPQPAEHNWLTQAAISAYETVRDHPLETTGGALLALAAIRFRGPIAEGVASLADDAARLADEAGRLIGGKKPLPQMSGPKDVSAVGGSAGTSAEAATSAVLESGTVVNAASRDGLSVAAPWVRRNGIKENVDLSDLLRTGHFDNVMPKGIQPGTIAIPSVRKDILSGGLEFPAATISVEREFGKRGFLYDSLKNSTVQILGTKEAGGGSGFFLRENGIGATANHVVQKFADGNFRVLMGNGEVLPARVIAREGSKDWALFKVDGLPYVKPFEFAPARSLQPGVSAHMIGHPAGIPEKVMNSGRIEAFNPVVKGADTPFLGIRHSIESYGGFSGSPVFVDSGKVAGIQSWGRFKGAHAEAVSVRHLRHALDDVTRRPMVNGIDDWRTSVVFSRNAQNMPKTEVLGRKV